MSHGVGWRNQSGRKTPPEPPSLLDVSRETSWKPFFKVRPITYSSSACHDVSRETFRKAVRLWTFLQLHSLSAALASQS